MEQEESSLFTAIFVLLEFKPMIGENRQLVTNEPVEFEK